MDESSDECFTPPKSAHNQHMLNVPLPYKKVRTLCLFGSPKTPTTLMETDGENSSAIVNVNPFSPFSVQCCVRRMKRLRSPASQHFDHLLSSEEDETVSLAVPQLKRANLNESFSLCGRYHSDFLEIGHLGQGQFGTVHKCIHRLDGSIYAVKRLAKPVIGSYLENVAKNEVYAHAVLGSHKHVVRYFSAWMEDSHMFIQNEYCNGGTLTRRIQMASLTQFHLIEFIKQMADGLNYIHSKQLVHLDIKPSNIFVCLQWKRRTGSSNYDDSCDDGFEDDGQHLGHVEDITYKIGDLGHITSVLNPTVEEGDCRYLSNEILQENYEHLPKADIFSLACTVLVAAGIVTDLPKNGDGWHQLRAGQLPPIPEQLILSRHLTNLLATMLQPQPELRPSARDLLRHPVITNRAKNYHLMVGPSGDTTTTVAPTMDKKLKERLLIGKKINRSMSTTNF